jgi:hypothetical protein
MRRIGQAKIELRSGFSVVEVMVGLGLLAAVAYFAATSMGTLFKSGKSIELADVSTTFSGDLGRYLRTQACGNELKGKPFPVTQTDLSFQFYKGVGSKTGVPVAKGLEVAQGARIEQMTGQEKAGVPASIVRLGGVDYELKVLQVELRMAVKVSGQTSWSPRAPTIFEIPVYVQGGVIRECRVGTDLTEACSVIGGTFDGVTCKPKEGCRLMGSYATVECDPKTYGCSYKDAVANNSSLPTLNEPPTAAQVAQVNRIIGNPATGGTASCPAGATPSLVSATTSNRTVSCGKKCSVNVATTTRYFMCMKCPTP